MPPPTVPANALTVQHIDIGASFEYARSDSAWLQKVLMHGLWMMVPVVGLLATLGWSRRIYHHVRQGNGYDGYPETNITDDIVGGGTPFVGLLNMGIVLGVFWGAAGVLAGIGFAVGQISGNESSPVMLGLMALAVIVLYGGALVIPIVSLVLGPELQRRANNGDAFPLLRLPQIIRIMRREPAAYLMAVAGLLCCQMVSMMGSLLCVAQFMTMPFGYVMRAHVLAQWDAVVERGQHVDAVSG